MYDILFKFYKDIKNIYKTPQGSSDEFIRQICVAINEVDYQLDKFAEREAKFNGYTADKKQQSVTKQH